MTPAHSSLRAMKKKLFFKYRTFRKIVLLQSDGIKNYTTWSTGPTEWSRLHIKISVSHWPQQIRFCSFCIFLDKSIRTNFQNVSCFQQNVTMKEEKYKCNLNHEFCISTAQLGLSAYIYMCSRGFSQKQNHIIASAKT